MITPYGATRTEVDTSLSPMDSHVRNLVDPDGTLPPVEIIIFEKEDIPGSFAREKAGIHHDGTEIGYLDLITSHAKGLMHFDFLTLDTTDRQLARRDTPHRERPKGLGLATYLIAIEASHERGLPFHSQEGALTTRSNRIWEILVDRGAAETITAPHAFNTSSEQMILASYKTDPHAS